MKLAEAWTALLYPETAAQKELRRQERERRELEEQDRERLKAMPPEYVITLVHGTQLSRWLVGPFVRVFQWPRHVNSEFQYGPPWIQRESALASHLTEALGWRVRIEPFAWKAYNTVRARAVAAAQLQTRLHDLRQQYPGAEQVIVAHSHGGNVALSALADPDDARRILGVATLATPFLTARRRQVEWLLDAGDAIAAALMAGFATLAIGFARGAGWSWWGWALAVGAGVFSLLLAGLWVTTVMKTTADAIAARMKPTSLTTEQVTIVRTHGDEAVAVIAGARVTGAFVNVVWRGLSEPILQALNSLLVWADYFGLRSMFRKLEEQVHKSDFSRPFPRPEEKPSLWEETKKAATPAIGPIIAMAVQDQDYPSLKWVILGIAALYGLPALLALGVTFISVIPSIVFSIGLLPCGWTVPFAAPYLDVTAEPAPPGTWRVTQFPSDGESGLAHSKSYDDPRVHTHLATWIRVSSEEKKKKSRAGEAGDLTSGRTPG